MGLAHELSRSSGENGVRLVPDCSPRRRRTTRKQWGAPGAAPSRSGWTTASTARWRTWPAPTATKTATRPSRPPAPGHDKGPVTCIAAGHGPSSTRGMGDSNPRGLAPNTLSKCADPGASAARQGCSRRSARWADGQGCERTPMICAQLLPKLLPSWPLRRPHRRVVFVPSANAGACSSPFPRSGRSTRDRAPRSRRRTASRPGC